MFRNGKADWVICGMLDCDPGIEEGGGEVAG